MDSLSSIAQEAGLIGRRAKLLFAAANVPYLFTELGLQLDEGTYNSPAFITLRTAVGSVSSMIDSLVQAAQEVEDLLATTNPDPLQLFDLVESVYDACRAVFTGFTAVKNALTNLQTTPAGTTQQEQIAFAQHFIDAATKYLLISHLQGFHNQLLGVLVLLGIVRDQVPPALNSQALPTDDKSFEWSSLTDLLRNPADYFTALYGWNTPGFAYRLFLLNLEQAAVGLGLSPYFDPSPYELADVPALYLNSFLCIQPAVNSSYAFDIILTAPVLSQTLVLPINLDGWEFEVSTSAALDSGSAFRINWNGSVQATLTNAAAAVSLSIVARLPANPTGQSYQMLTTPFGVGVTAQAIEVSATFSTPVATAANTLSDEAAIAFAAEFTGLNVKIEPGEADSFIGKLLGENPVNLESDLAIEWTQAKGIALRGGQGLLPKKNINLELGLLHILYLAIGLDPQNDATRVVSTFGAMADLGPVRVTVDDMGFAAQLSYAPGNLGPFGLSLGFKSPSGIGIEITSDTITGGGYLFLDQPNHKYAGVAQLTFKDKINLNAVGLLQTELPNNPNGYSFVLLITAQFSPIQLGFGFTLNAVGGLIGINRSFSTSYLRNLVQSGGMDSLLFPANVLANPQLAIATVDNAFPATEGRYVFGLMARIGWGTPNLITLDAALIIELPSPVRLALLGVLRAVLPDLNNPIIRLRADFLGTVDFGAKKVSFDAMLVDSRILQFALTGNMAFRLYQGDNPVFLLTAGGFHPAFQPPANADLPTLRRITLALAQGGDFRLTLTSYLAITSNTVQFGSRLDLYVGLPASYYIEGYLAFDALFQFNPFHVQVQIGAGVAIKRNGSSKLSISLSLLVSGPGPWHVKGEGSFKILFIRIRFGIDRTFGSNASQPALPTTDVRALLKAALGETASWEVLPPATRASSTTVLRKDEQPTYLLIDPGGALVIKQKIVPLDFPVDVYGNTRTTNGNRFNITSASLGGPTNLLPIPGASLGEIREAFAPGQFKRMSDSEKLSSPSFQLLRNGVRLNAIDGLVGSVGIVRDSDFEMRVIEPATGTNLTSNRPSSSNTNLVAGGTTTGPVITPSSGTAILPDVLFQRLTRNGANGRARRSYQQRRPSRKAPDQVLWDEDAYAVVSTRTLQPQTGAPNPFATEAEATAYVTAQLAQNPSLAGELQVVPVYQLDVTAPDTTSSYATA